jgi:hypothetical protein
VISDYARMFEAREAETIRQYRWLQKVQKAATHHYPLSIMAAGPNLPEDFHLGSMRGEGEPLPAVCRDALVVIKQVQAELDA